MTVCGNKLSGVCGDCKYLNLCRNNEIANLPKSNIEWMREASFDELAEWLDKLAYSLYTNQNRMTCKEDWELWLKQPHCEVGK